MSTALPTAWLVTGANRGIGLEIVRQLLASPTNLVVAGVRTPEKATALIDLKSTAKGTLHVIKLDVSNFASIRASAKDLEAILGDSGLDYLINNAGVGPRDTGAFTIDPDALLEAFKTNSVGPVLVSQVALPFLEKGSTKKILHISSTSGSIGSADEMGAVMAGYSMTKSALNMLVYKQKLERPDLTVIALCPGSVKTDMTGEYGMIEPYDSVVGVLKVITSATAADSGKFLRYNGETIPW
ncbi:NAD-P-binding protein [Trametes versicolor FP-101664 SS1]|uniref:NAD-P-binding protein n=1 Tax=Trametes versicolor (strain FP-101664) TaxID=717944 RepID=UPI0004623981|nr:NAD-P-binding protein [Trametes versicolor FP-101664 SS1]EIW54646.1 NAD-P-binding protein [Trametes versicolor FP-101664 SS1]